MRRRALLPALALVLATALSGCGGDDSGSGGSDGPTAFTEEQLEDSLLTTDDIGEDYRVKTDEDDDSPAPGCLSALSSIDDGFPGSDEDVETTIQADTESEIPEVDLKISSFDDADAAAEALADFADSLDGCTGAQGADDDGIEYDLTVETGDDTTGDEVDHQFNLDMEGTVSNQGQDFPVALRIRFLQVENVISAVAISSLVETDTEDATDELAGLGLQRLVALVEGEDQPELDPLDLEVFTG